MAKPKNSKPLANRSEKVVVMRNEKGQLLPGYTPNPYGKPKGARHMTTLLREAIIKIADGDEEPADIMIVKKVIQQAKAGSETSQKMVWDRLDGSALQTLVFENTDDGLSDEQKRKLNALLGLKE